VSNNNRTVLRVKFDPQQLTYKLLEVYAARSGLDTSAAIRELLLFSLLEWWSMQPDLDDLADYDVLYHRWTGTLEQDASENYDEFVRWMARQEMPARGGKRQGAGRKSK